MNNLKRIIIIEQERLISLDLQRLLENKGYIIPPLSSLTQLESVLTTNKPHIAIVDAGIRKEKNFDEIKKLFTLHQLPIICIGTLTDKEAFEKCEGVYFIKFFPKPFEGVEIIEYIADFFRN